MQLKMGLSLCGNSNIGNYLTQLLGKYGVPGLLFDNSAPTVFTDSAGTTAAGYGDVVGKLLDKSGGGSHLSQATTAAKPILRAGPLLEFDGADDYLSGTNPFTGDELTLIWCGKWRSESADKYHLSFGDTTNNANYLSLRTTSTVGQILVESAGTLGANTFGKVIADTTTLSIYSIRLSPTVNELSVNQDRTVDATPITYNLSAADIFTAGALGRTTAGLFSDANDSFIYGLSKYITDTELDQVENFIATECGVTL